MRADVVGLLLAGLGVLGIVYGIVSGNDAGWGSFEVVGALVVGGVLILAFVRWESRTSIPLLPLWLFRDRSFTVSNVVGVVFSFGIFGGMDRADTVGERAIQRDVVTIPARGVGLGLVVAPLSTAVLANMRTADHAKASGTNSTLREVGVALGIAVLTAVFTGAGGTLTPTGYVDAAIPAVWVGAGTLLLAFVASLALPSRARAGQLVADRVEADESPVPAVAPHELVSNL